MAPPNSADGPATSADPLLDRLRLATRGVYEVEGELGRGGMAVVYLGLDTRLERRVAIKVMDPRLSLTQGMAERFLREARLAARLQHPNIIVVYEIRQSEEIVFFVMSLIDGVALDELCRKHAPLPIEQVRWILLQASRALAFAHSENVVHRDIKPANILLNFKGEVILTDFGIAKALGGEGLTQSGQSIGTPVYMSPEQFSGMEMGPATDQYSLGVTAYQLLTGKPPFSGDLYQLVAAHGTVAPVPLQELRPDCPSYLANAVMRMLSKKPKDRWPSLEDLEEVFGANMAMDGGPARRQLAAAAVALRRERAGQGILSMPRTPATPTPIEKTDTFVITISPPGATIFVGGTLDMRASVSLDTGQSLPGAAVTWTSSEHGVLLVAANGAVSGVHPGVAVVRAAVPGAWSEATIRVEPAPLARLTVSQPSITLRVGDVARPEVFAVDVNGATHTDAPLVWISRAPGVAELDAPGTIRAIAPGPAVIDVSVGNVRRSIDITVVRRPVSRLQLRTFSRQLETGGALALSVDVFDDLGNAVAAPPLRWMSSAPSVIHVDSAGTALAIGPGLARITASVDAASDSIELEALEPPIGAIELTLRDSVVEAGDDTVVGLRVRDPNGGMRSNAGVRVWSSAPMVAEVDPVTWVVRTHVAGEAQICAGADDARSSAAQESVTLVVQPIAIARLEVFPESLDLEAGGVAALHVRALDRRGRPVPQVTTTWRSDARDVAVVEGQGTVRAMSAGSTTLRAAVMSAGGASVEHALPITVRQAPVIEQPIAPTERITPAVVAAAIAQEATVPLQHAASAKAATPITAEPVLSATEALGAHRPRSDARRIDTPQAPASTTRSPERAPAASSKQTTVIAGVGLAVAVALFGLFRMVRGNDNASTRDAAAPDVVVSTDSVSKSIGTPEPVTPPIGNSRPTTPALDTAAAPPNLVPASSPPATNRDSALRAMSNRSASRVDTARRASEPVQVRDVAPAPVNSSTTAASRLTPTAPVPVSSKGAQAKPQPTVTEESPPPAPVGAVEAPTRDDLRAAADRIADEVRSGRRRSAADLSGFFSDGAEHRVAVSGAPTVVSESGGRTRAEFTLRLSRVNTFGIPERRVVAVTMEVTRRNQVATLESASLGALTKSR